MGEQPRGSAVFLKSMEFLKVFKKQDLLALVLLIAGIGVSWCAANGKWSASDWNFVHGYNEVETSDVLATLASLKVVSEGHFLLMGWKFVPELGAPSGANWNDYPVIEEIPILMQGFWAHLFGIFAGLNFSLLIGHILAGTSFYLVARQQGASMQFGFLGALAFGLAPFAFSQSPHHITVASIWHLPLFLPVWKWCSNPAELVRSRPKLVAALGVGFLTGLHNIYFTNIFCQICLLAGAIAAIRQKSWKCLLPVGAIIASAALAFVLMNVDTLTYKLANGPNTAAVVREYKWLEIYGLKIVDLFVPPPDHRAAIFSNFGLQHKISSVLQDEGSYLGIAGIAALGLLIAVSLSKLIQNRAAEVPREFWYLFWIVAVFTTGGINALVGTAGLTLFRAGCRYSVVILVVVLFFAVLHLSKMGFSKSLKTLLFVGALFIIVVDQVPRAPTPQDSAAVEFQIISDRNLVHKMEKRLPPGAMVFQLPIMDFPESPVPGITPYEHFRPFLFSKDLKFSFGSMKGRADMDWQRELIGKPPQELLRKLNEKGFDAIILNTKGYADGGKSLISTLQTLGVGELLVSENNDLVGMILDPNRSGSPR